MNMVGGIIDFTFNHATSSGILYTMYAKSKGSKGVGRLMIRANLYHICGIKDWTCINWVCDHIYIMIKKPMMVQNWIIGNDILEAPNWVFKRSSKTRRRSNARSIFSSIGTKYNPLVWKKNDTLACGQGGIFMAFRWSNRIMKSKVKTLKLKQKRIHEAKWT